MTYEKVNKPISVYTFSRKGKTKIKAFEWEGRIFRISNNNLTTKARRGYAPVYLFSVSNDSGSYKLRFDAESMNWWIDEAYWKH